VEYMLAAYPLRHDRPRQHVGRVHLRARGHHGVAPHQEDTSPKTGATLESTMLFPNLSLRTHDPRLQRGGLGGFD
jgi:hypothetical protein